MKHKEEQAKEIWPKRCHPGVGERLLTLFVTFFALFLYVFYFFFIVEDKHNPFEYYAFGGVLFLALKIVGGLVIVYVGTRLFIHYNTEYIWDEQGLTRRNLRYEKTTEWEEVVNWKYNDKTEKLTFELADGRRIKTATIPMRSPLLQDLVRWRARTSEEAEMLVDELKMKRLRGLSHMVAQMVAQAAPPDREPDLTGFVWRVALAAALVELGLFIYRRVRNINRRQNAAGKC